MPLYLDDLATPVLLPDPVTRVVSLVPSLTEALVATRPDAVVGATDWCTHPADLDVARVRGTKNPDLAAIRDLAPQVVIANKEESRELDVQRLRESGVAVWVTVIEDVPSAIASMTSLFAALGWGMPAWLAEVRAAWDKPVPPPHTRVAVPIWRDPWMVVGRDTFTGDLLRRLGYANVFAEADGRYPHVDRTALDDENIDLVLLPDEPYVFGPDDAAELSRPTALVNGRLLTWYGPSLLEAARFSAGGAN